MSINDKALKRRPRGKQIQYNLKIPAAETERWRELLERFEDIKTLKERAISRAGYEDKVFLNELILDAIESGLPSVEKQAEALKKKLKDKRN